MVTYDTLNVPMPDIDPTHTAAWIEAVAQSYGRKLGDVAYVFCDDAAILDANRRHLGHDYYTDIITFDRSEGRHIAGDVIISLDTVRSNAEGLGTSYREELHRVIVHGILHLCGEKDKAPGEREQMEVAEDRALAMLRGMRP